MLQYTRWEVPDNWLLGPFVHFGRPPEFASGFNTGSGRALSSTTATANGNASWSAGVKKARKEKKEKKENQENQEKRGKKRKAAGPAGAGGGGDGTHAATAATATNTRTHTRYMFPASMLTHIVWRNVAPDPTQGHALGTDGTKKRRKRPTGLKYNKVKEAAAVSLSGVGEGELGACAGGSRQRNRAADIWEQHAVRDGGGGAHGGCFAGTKVYILLGQKYKY